MRVPALSLRSIFGLIVGCMGALALVQALVSGEVHRGHAYANQRLSMERLLHLKADDLLTELAHRSGDLGASLQTAPTFQQAFQARDAEAMRRLMANQFHDYFVTTGMLKLEELAVFDPGFALVARLRGKVSRFSSATEDCMPLIRRAREPHGPARMKLLSGLCQHASQPYHAVILPIGGLRLKGYMIVTTDPVHNLAKMEDVLGMPVSIHLPGREALYQSERWQASMAPDSEAVIADYMLPGEDGRPALAIAAVEDVRPLMGYLPRTRQVVMAAVAYTHRGLVGVAVFFVSTFLLHKIESYYLSPRLTAKHVKLPGFVIVTSLVLFEHAFGLVGLFMDRFGSR